jgi:hypothetical protein
VTPEQVLQLIDSLAQRLGPAGQHVFELAVRETIIGGIMRLIAGLVLLAMAAALFAASRHFYRAASEEEHEEGPPGFDQAAAGLVLSVVAMVLLWLCVPSLLNPEWEALGKIAAAVK